MIKTPAYFPHECTMIDDPKIMKLMNALQMEGYGIFNMLLEKLTKEPGHKLPYDADLIIRLAKNYDTTPEKIKAVICNFNLFIIQNDEFFFSTGLVRRLSKAEEYYEQKRLAGIKSGEARRLRAENSTTYDNSDKSRTDVEQRSSGVRTGVEQNERYNLTQSNLTQLNLNKSNQSNERQIKNNLFSKVNNKISKQDFDDLIDIFKINGCKDDLIERFFNYIGKKEGIKDYKAMQLKFIENEKKKMDLNLPNETPAQLEYEETRKQIYADMANLAESKRLIVDGNE